MDRDELFEEIRALLLEGQTVAGVVQPYRYDDTELIRQVRSSLRQLRVVGVSTEAEMTVDGTLDPEPTEAVGTLISYVVAARLLTGDMTQKLMEGELGVHFRAGRDVIDTKDAERGLQRVAVEYSLKADTMLTIVLSDQDGGANSVFGEQTTSLV